MALALESAEKETKYIQPDGNIHLVKKASISAGIQSSSATLGTKSQFGKDARMQALWGCPFNYNVF